MTDPLRFLLDQQFPKPRFDVHALDRSVEYVHLADYSPQHARTSTPDWMVYLLAAEGGFDGVVTLDRRQLDEEVELIALTQADVSVVTWKSGDEDPIVLWGQLLAYMPQVVRLMREVRPVVVTLPNPRLQMRTHAEKPSDVARAMKQRDQVSFSERKARALRIMRNELARRGDTALAAHLTD